MSQSSTSDASHHHLIDTGKGGFDLEDLGHLLPGMAEIMPLVAERIWKCYYAGRAQNRKLASFQLKEAINLMHKAEFLRPKYAENMDAFLAKEVASVQRSIDGDDWDTFEITFTAMVEAANGYHELYEKPYLRWRIPDGPPPDLDMTAGMGR
jgi:hypothetical protein